MSSPLSILQQYWGFDAFRPQQEAIIGSVLDGHDTLALLPTGGGKSLCYQVPALLNDGFCLVISPLIALMQDQVARLKQHGAAAACIHAGMRYNEVKKLLQNMLHGPYKILYVSPERLQTRLFRDFLPEFDISLIAVDEAHCISQWGHDFRPDYLKIAELREVFPDVPVLALTASATPEVQHDIAVQLKFQQAKAFRRSFERPNIFYEIQYSENKTGDTIAAVRELQGSCIIYCRSRRQTEVLSKTLHQQGITALAYHAGMSKDRRDAAQQAWIDDETRIIVATTAFGMGIDKADVRLVIHYDAPEHLEAWYQEAGRAGRDDAPSRVLTLFNASDIKRLESSTDIHFPPEAYLRHVYQSVAEYLQIATGTAPDQYFDFDIGDFSKKFKLDALAATHALKLLEREGLWTLSESVYHPSAILFTAGREQLDMLLQRYPDIGYVANGLLRRYSGLFHYPTPVRIPALAKLLKRTQEQVETALQQLHSMGILEYSKPGEGPQLYFHHYRVDSRQLIIDTQRIARLREWHEKRTHAMIAFLQNDARCRDRLLLRYFGEDPVKDCGHCDVCRKKQYRPVVDAKLLKEQIIRALQRNGRTTVPALQAVLPGVAHELLTAMLRRMSDTGLVTISGNGQISLPGQ